MIINIPTILKGNRFPPLHVKFISEKETMHEHLQINYIQIWNAT